MKRKHGLDMDKVLAHIRDEVAPRTYRMFVSAGWTWIFTEKGVPVQRCPTADEIAEQYKDNLKEALKWWRDSDQYKETLSCGRLQVAVHGKTAVEYIDFMIAADSYWAVGEEAEAI